MASIGSRRVFEELPNRPEERALYLEQPKAKLVPIWPAEICEMALRDAWGVVPWHRVCVACFPPNNIP